MTPAAALGVVASIVALAVLLGLVYRLRNGQVRRVSAERVRPAELPGSPGFGESLTLLQFSTEFCAPCRQTARLLGGVSAARSGVAHVELDVTDDLDTVRRFNILRTPTTLVLDEKGAVVGRISGAPRVDELDAFLAELLEEAGPAKEVTDVRN